MSIAPMQLPAWLDVTLEGGVLELQRGLAGYIELRSLLRGNWKRRAISVAECAEELMRVEAKVDAALNRARNRAQLEKRARVVLPLVERVELERERLLGELEALTSQPSSSLQSALRLAAEQAREEGWFESAWRNFHRERSFYGGLMLVGIGALPLVSWLQASKLGFIPTLVDVRELGGNAFFWMVMAAVGGLTGQAWRRLGVWKFLGVKRPSLALPSVLSAGAAGLAFFLKLPFHAVTAFATLGLVAPLALTTSVSAVWTARRGQALLPGDAPSPPPVAEASPEDEASQPAARTPVAIGARRR